MFTIKMKGLLTLFLKDISRLTLCRITDWLVGDIRVSLLMAYANYKIRHLTGSSATLTVLAFMGLMLGTVLIIYYEISNQPQQLLFIAGLYALLTLGSWSYSRAGVDS